MTENKKVHAPDIIENWGSRSMSDTDFRKLLLDKVAKYDKKLRKKRESKANRQAISSIREARTILRRAISYPKGLIAIDNKRKLKVLLRFNKDAQDALSNIQAEIERSERYPTTKRFREDIEKLINSISLRKSILTDAFKMSSLNGHLPTLVELAKYMDVARSTLREYFEDNLALFEGMKQFNRKEYDTYFNDDDFSIENQERILKNVAGGKRYFITAVACGSEVSHQGAVLDTIEKWAAKRDAEVILLPYGNIGGGGMGLHKIHRCFKRKGFNLLLSELALNTNLMVIPFQSTLTLHNPQQSLHKISSRYKCSIIAPAPKLTKGTCATDTGKLSHRTWTTGAITEPKYRTGDRILPSKHQFFAGTEHEISGIIIEIRNDKIFHSKEVMFDVDGSFVELRKKGTFRHFPSGKVERENMIHFSIPDSHVEEANKTVEQIFMDIGRINKVHSVALHDIFSYRGPGHHTPSIVDQAKIIESGWSYNKDIGLLGDFLIRWSKVAKHVRIIRSNHDEHPVKALKGNHLNNPATLRLQYTLGLMELNGQHVLEESLRNVGFRLPENIVFLKKRQRYVLKNKFGEMAAHHHGDKGADGARSGSGITKNSLSMSVGCGNAGHTHKDEIHSGASFGGLGNGGMWFNGTTDSLGKDAPEYTDGPSTWSNTGTAVFGRPDGRFLRTQVQVINGLYCLD